MKAGKYVSYIWCWPQDVLMWLLWILPFWALWGEDLRWQEGSLVFNLKADSWPSRTWYKKWGGTSIGHAIMYRHSIPRMDVQGNRPAHAPIHRTIIHEQYHVRQFESIAFTAFVTSWIPFAFLGAAGLWTSAIICWLAVWLLGHTLHGLGNFFVALIMGERFYRDSYHEQAAYAVDFKYQRTGKRDS